ncbi:MAG: homoserine kinase [Azovibrio sp.]|uniref:homoserine kinase n=1 Tax=Azovibrio sp. TaxID=1872673 RepID=UPI003C728F59
MSVYTPVSRAELEAWLSDFAVGRLLDYQGISAGIENSNYFVETSAGRFVLTLFEALQAGPLQFYLDLQAQLAASGFPCPRPRCSRAGALQRPLAGKPAALFSRLPGTPVELASAEQCREIGRQLARFHTLTRNLPDCPPHSRDLNWRRHSAARLGAHLEPAAQTLLARALAVDAALPWAQLESGLIHADLFRDNVLWDGECLGGILDFYFAGVDALIFDLAVSANDWCRDAARRPDQARLQALLQGYAAERPLGPLEKSAWPGMLVVAALRFWLSRLEVAVAPRSGAIVTAKDPEDFRQLLAWRLQHLEA